MTSRSASESSASPRLVEPLRSEKTMVTTLRISWGAGASASCDPQARQNRAMSGVLGAAARAGLHDASVPGRRARNRLVGADAATEHLAHIAELERRDAAIARELETVRAVSERVGESTDARIGDRTALERLPPRAEGSARGLPRRRGGVPRPVRPRRGRETARGAWRADDAIGRRRSSARGRRSRPRATGSSTPSTSSNASRHGRRPFAEQVRLGQRVRRSS